MNKSRKLLLLVLERFSFECRKEIGFAFATLHDWLKKFAPIFHPIRSKGPFINYGSGGGGGGGWRKIRGGGPRKKKSRPGGGLPKLFCLMRGGLEKNKLVSSDYLVIETNVVEYLVLM